MRLHDVVAFSHEKENWQPVAGPGSVFPSFGHVTIQHALITCCNVSRAGVHCLTYHDWGTFDFSRGHVTKKV